MKKPLLVLVVLFGLFVRILMADDGTPYCETTYRGLGEDREVGSAPTCDTSWTEAVEADYILPAMSEMGMAHMSWTNTSIGNPITRIFQEERIDLSGGDNWYNIASFEGDYLYYAVGGRITWGPGAAEDSCGFYLRSTADDDTLYFVDMNQYGYVYLEELDAGIWQPSRRVPTANLHTGAGATNTLMVIVLRNFFRVFVNGEHVARFNDSTNMDTYGHAGLVATTYDESDETYCLFEEAWIWPIDNWRWD